MLALKSHLQTAVNMDNNSILNTHQVAGQIQESFFGMTVILGLVVIMLFILCIFQLIMSIETNLKDNLW